MHINYMYSKSGCYIWQPEHLSNSNDYARPQVLKGLCFIPSKQLRSHLNQGKTLFCRAAFPRKNGIESQLMFFKLSLSYMLSSPPHPH